jgi:hypothetical protein
MSTATTSPSAPKAVESLLGRIRTAAESHDEALFAGSVYGRLTGSEAALHVRYRTPWSWKYIRRTRNVSLELASAAR